MLALAIAWAVAIPVIFGSIALDSRCRVCRRWWAYLHAANLHPDDCAMEMSCVYCFHTIDLHTEEPNV